MSGVFQCGTCGKDYQCEDSLSLDSLVAQLAAVTGDSQQRGHYLDDDMEMIVDTVTGLMDTLVSGDLYRT